MTPHRRRSAHRRLAFVTKDRNMVREISMGSAMRANYERCWVLRFSPRRQRPPIPPHHTRKGKGSQR